MFSLICTRCDWQAADADLSACPRCGATIDLHYSTTAIVPDNQQLGIWRYADHLPLTDLQYAVSLGEGNTPLLRAARIGDGIALPELYFKMEGANPTGSYKDRIAAVGIARLQALSKRAWAATSSGNAGVACWLTGSGCKDATAVAIYEKTRTDRQRYPLGENHATL